MRDHFTALDASASCLARFSFPSMVVGWMSWKTFLRRADFCFLVCVCGGGGILQIVVWNEVRRCFITRLAFCLEWLSLGIVLKHISGSWKDELRLPL